MLVGEARRFLSTAWEHELEPVNLRAEYDRVDGYFIDLRPRMRARDRAGYVAEEALGWWERHIRGEREATVHFADAVARLHAGATRLDGILLWWHDTRCSASAQGQSASVFVRDYLRTGDERCAADARAAIAPLLDPDPRLGLVAPTPDGPVLVEGAAPGSRAVLHGWIYALWGLRDVAVGLQDDRAQDVYERSVRALALALSYYDTGSWTRYSLDRDGWDIASPAHHALHTVQIEVMARLTRHAEFAHAAERWRRYDTRVNRMRSVLLRARAGVRRPRRTPITGPARVRAVVHHPYPVTEVRGEREALAFRDAGLDVEVVCLRQPGEPAHERVDDIAVRRLPIEHNRGATLPGLLKEYLGFTAAAGLALSRSSWQRRPELVHVHAPPDFLLAASLIPRLRGARVLLDIHDLSRDMFDARFGDRLLARIGVAGLIAVERLACALADRVVTVHKPYADELARLGVPTAKIGVVMNAIDERVLSAVRHSSAGAAREEAFTVAYHGTITAWYGLDVLVEAVALARADVPSIRAVIVGGGDALEETRQLAHDLGVGTRVEFPGNLAHAAALGRVGVADCGVVPNRSTKLNRFALSSKLFEYVALGVPVAVARLETLAQHFNDDEVLFFTPGDAASLARALVSIAHDPQTAASRAERARKRAEDQYSWSQNRETLLAHAFALVPEPPSAAWRPPWWDTAVPAEPR